MKNIVFTTKSYDKEAKSHSETSSFQNFKNRIEKDGHPKTDEYGFNGNYVKKRHGGNLRTIFSYKDCTIYGNNVRIYVALRMMARGDKDYEKFKYPYTADSDRDKITGLSQIDWNEFVEKAKEILNNSDNKKIEKKELSDSERIFISSTTRINHELMDVAIFESREWTELLKLDTFEYYSDAAEIIEQYILDHLSSSGESKFEIPFKNYQDKKIIGYHKGYNKWYLVTIIDSDKQIDFDPCSIEVRRGYPWSSLDDKDAWREMEKDKNSNFVLSEEEMEIVSREPSYPLFIGGRAGSGKSTVLQYLFAEIILRYLKSMIDEEKLLPPVYLSYSENLIENAKVLATSLFEKNHSYQDAFKETFQETGRNFENDIKPNMDKLFGVFQDIIKECIGEKNQLVLRERFNKSKYISFSRFNAEWNKKFAKDPEATKKYGPSLSWYVIRTYIKGWDSESYLTPEDYMCIGEKNKNVSDDTYKLIYDKVWIGWYSNYSDVWDDQDLVRYCISPDDNSEETYATERYSAIFCDEAQDFTRVEIDFILKVSSFSKRKINSVDDIKRLPFVFAGDEFQTLNPTGFSWDSIRAFFVDRLFSMVDLGELKDESNIEKPILLTKNYRSMPEIVRLSNRIQLLRAARFEEESQPQIAHFDMGKKGSVFCLDPNDDNVWKKLKENKVVLITPISDGESIKEYVENGDLKNHIEIDLESGVPKDITILNPIQAKGLEYPNVAIYGFKNSDGDKNKSLCLDNLLEWFNNPTEQNEQEEQSIGLKYLVSNTYVAATRACTKLYILDSFTEDNYWAFAYSFANADSMNKVELLESAMLQKTKNKWNKECLGYIIKGYSDEITDENIVDTAEYGKRIEEMEKRADNRGDANLMLQAAARYREHDNESGYNRCRAKAALIKEMYEQAAEFFIKTKMYDDAVRCYWKIYSNNNDVKYIKEIANYTDKVQGNVEREITKLCDDCIKAKISVERFGLVIANILGMLASNPNEDFDKKVWSKALDLLSSHIDVANATSTDLKRVIENKSKLSKIGIVFSCQNIAKAAFVIKDYYIAVKLWEENQIVNFPQEYYISKIETSLYPEKIIYYEKAYPESWQTKVIEEYESSYCNLNIESKYQKIISTAICEKSATEIFNKSLAKMLVAAESEKQIEFILNSAKQRHITVNTDVIMSLSSVRFNDLKKWKYPSIQYNDTKAMDLFTIVNCIKDIFEDSTSKQKQNKQLKDYLDDTYAKYRYYAFVPLLLQELGASFEKRGIHIDAIRYYEWARTLTKSSDLKTYFQLRWIVCKERQADRDISSDYWKEAKSKRIELGVEEMDIPDSPTITFEEWCKYYETALSISDELYVPIETDHSNEYPTAIESDSIENSQLLKKQTLQYGDYEICYIPKSKDIVIKYSNNEDELNTKIRKGMFPSEGDFILKDSRIYRTDDGTRTPLAFSLLNDKVIIKVFQDDLFTGIEIAIDL